MYYVYIDSGTTNTRIYLAGDFTIVDTIKVRLGSKDSSNARDNSVLIKKLKDIYDELLERNSLKDKDVQKIFASGMVTCPYGIFEVPHLVVPVDINKLYREMYIYKEKVYFKRTIWLIRGVKTLPEDTKADIASIQDVNNMRGEEIEIFGILSKHSNLVKFQEDCAIFMPGSHTHICYVSNGSIRDILSTFTGELNYALSTCTILGGELDDTDDDLDKEMILKGYKAIRDNGMCRALYLVHASKILDVIDNKSRRFYLNGIIAGSAVDAFCRKREKDWKNVKKVIIAGSQNYIQSYKVILDYVLNDVETIVIEPGKEAFSFNGFIEILKREVAGLCQSS